MARKPFHVVRATSAQMIGTSLLQAQIAAGSVLDHRQVSTTTGHYLDDFALQKMAVEQMPWPPCMVLRQRVEPTPKKKLSAAELVDDRVVATMEQFITRLDRRLGRRPEPVGNGTSSSVGKVFAWLRGVFKGRASGEPEAAAPAPDLPALDDLQKLIDSDPPKVEAEPDTSEWTEGERLVWEHLSHDEPVSAEQLVIRLSCAAQEVTVPATLLMMRGVARRVPGNAFIKGKEPTLQRRRREPVMV